MTDISTVLLVVARGETMHTFLEKLIFIIIQIEIEFYIIVAVYFYTYITRYIYIIISTYTIYVRMYRSNTLPFKSI